ncbi:MAG: hypothetical protein RBT74_09430 [Tenuifilaceae bacterium]|nr:hypothetical protein [Tenuifilaceae bacterium]
MAEQNCENCPMRVKYDAKPKSFAGRFWRWHINFCPGWKGYMSSFSEDERVSVAQKYQLRKYL